MDMMLYANIKIYKVNSMIYIVEHQKAPYNFAVCIHAYFEPILKLLYNHIAGFSLELC